MTGRCRINGKEIQFLLDTGSVKTIISQEVATLTGVMIRKGSMSATTCIGSEIEVVGEAEVEIDLMGHRSNAQVMIVKGLANECLLGCDLLRKHPQTTDSMERLGQLLEESANQLPETLSEEGASQGSQVCTVSAMIDDKKPGEEKPEAAEIVEEFDDVFSRGLQSFERSKTVHIIELTDATPFRENFRAVPHAKREEFKGLVTDLKQAGMIVDSKSPFQSSTNLVRKTDGSFRITLNYKRLNSVTVKDNYPLPVINELLHRLKTAIIFSKLDFDSGYYQITMDENSRRYTAFACEYGFYEWTVLPMGLKNSGATFQREMDKILDGLIGVCCNVYMDDIIIYSNTVQEHKGHLRAVLQRIRASGMKIKKKKCEFFKAEIEYLGHRISEGCLKPSLTKVETLYRIQRPRTMRQILSFLGLASYYRKFIRNFAAIASPLYDITGKNQKYQWNPEAEEAFNTLRTALTSTEQVLTLPDFEKQFKLETDASNTAIGAILSQQKEEEKVWKPCAYFAKHLSKTQRNYCTSERELLAIVLAIEHFKQFLYGTEFIVVTDHQPLQWLMTRKNPAPKLARYITRLEQYTFTIEYRQGKQHLNADALSRLPMEPDEDENREDGEVIINMVEIQVTIGGNRIQVRAVNLIPINDDGAQETDQDIEWIKRVMREEEEDSPVANDERKVYLRLKSIMLINESVLWMKSHNHRGEPICLYVTPKIKRGIIMKQLHESETSGHLMFDKTVERACKRYFWPRQQRQIREYISACIPCQKATEPKTKQRAALKPIFSSKPMELVTSDFLGPLKKSRKGNKHIQIVVDHFTKVMGLYATKDQKAETTAPVVADFFLKYGIPDKFLSDQGRNYQSVLIAQLLELLDVHQLRTTIFRPQTDGISERGIRSTIR